MSGYTKYMFTKDIDSIKQELTKYIKALIPVLPEKYDGNAILALLKEFYPFEWNLIFEKYEYYRIKDKSLKSHGMKSRFSMPEPEKLLQSLPVYKKVLSESYMNAHAERFDVNTYKDAVEKLSTIRKPKIQSRTEKIEKMKQKAQLVEPDFLDLLMGLYDRKNTKQRDKVYILKELEKYYCPKVIKFFKKKVDTEYNRQLREMAFLHLQRLGHFAGKLRKQKYMRIPSRNRKRRKYLKEIYAFERNEIKEIPEELEYRISNSKEQKIKSFDFFISHSSNDYYTVQKLILNLNENNLNVYCDWISDTDYLKRNLVCQSTLAVIKKRIEQSNAILFVSSLFSRSSKWVKYELNYAFELKKPIYIISTDDIENVSFNYQLMKDIWFLDADYKNIGLF